MAGRIPNEDLRDVGNRESKRRAQPGDVTRFGKQPEDGEGSITRPGNPLSHRSSVLVAGVIGIILFRWITSGKLNKAASAWSGAAQGTNDPKPATPADTGAGVEVIPSAPTGGTTGLHQNPFGFTPSYGPKVQTGWIDSDQAIMPTSEELNLGTGMKSVPFTLPAGDNWKLIKNQAGYNGGVGGVEVWQSEQTGGLLGFLHLQQNTSAQLGQTVQGGKVAGMTGWPLSAQYGVGGAIGPGNAHLAVLLDPKTQRELGL